MLLTSQKITRREVCQAIKTVSQLVHLKAGPLLRWQNVKMGQAGTREKETGGTTVIAERLTALNLAFLLVWNRKCIRNGPGRYSDSNLQIRSNHHQNFSDFYRSKKHHLKIHTEHKRPK